MGLWMKIVGILSKVANNVIYYNLKQYKWIWILASKLKMESGTNYLQLELRLLNYFRIGYKKYQTSINKINEEN